MTSRQPSAVRNSIQEVRVVANARKSRDFRDLRVWQKAHRLVLETYSVTNAFPKSELFGLTSQIRRSALSVPANIAEGCGRGGKDLVRFCRIAIGSASELEYHFIVAHDLNLIDLSTYDQVQHQIVEVKRMLTGLVDSLTAGDPTLTAEG